tara:strand:- start:1406 stop:2950 length:1545 start_codon:yes stop_codon:yes gene_type:complete
MASVSDIAPLSATANTGTGDDGIQAEITKLADTIIKSSTDGLKSATQAVVGNVPQMISDLTEDIKSGPVDKFAIAMNKLVTLVDKLGINLRQYNEDLADTVEEFRGAQEKTNEKLAKLREQGIRAEINQKTGNIKLLTEKESKLIEQRIIKREKIIEKREKETRLELKKDLDTAKGPGRIKREEKILKNEEKIVELKQKNIDDEEKVRPGGRVDTGFSGNDQGFGRLGELKEAFMVVPDTIAEVFGSFKNIGKVLTASFVGFFKNPMKTIKKVFGAIANVFKIARVAIALKVMAVIMVFQWIAEKLGAIGDVFQNIWNKITGFFKAIGDWFKNSWLGKKLGLGGDDEGEGEKEKTGGVLSSEGTGQYSQLDDGTYEVGNIEPGTSKKDMVAESESKWYKPWTWGKDKKDDKIVPSIDKDVEKEFASADDKAVKSIMKSKSVIGQTSDGIPTPQKLEDLQKELKSYEERNVIQVNNNSQVNSNSSNGTTVSGFVDHEPDTSFKYIRNNNSDINWI